MSEVDKTINSQLNDIASSVGELRGEQRGINARLDDLHGLLEKTSIEIRESIQQDINDFKMIYNEKLNENSGQHKRIWEKLGELSKKINDIDPWERLKGFLKKVFGHANLLIILALGGGIYKLIEWVFNLAREYFFK